MTSSDSQKKISGPNNKAIVLLSGGLDSATTLAFAQKEGYDIYALSFDYGQRHHAEIGAAQKIARRAGIIEHLISHIDLRHIGGSALTDDLTVPKDRPPEALKQNIPVTYVPARNTIFLSIALAWAEVLRAAHIFIGVNALDYSGYPDCRPEYIHAFQAMANLATKSAVADGQRITIHAPLLHLNKADIIKLGLELDVDYSLTTSCYDPDEHGTACGHCDACTLRQKGFLLNNKQDPIAYQQ